MPIVVDCGNRMECPITFFSVAHTAILIVIPSGNGLAAIARISNTEHSADLGQQDTQGSSRQINTSEDNNAGGNGLQIVLRHYTIMLDKVDDQDQEHAACPEPSGSVYHVGRFHVDCSLARAALYFHITHTLNIGVPDVCAVDANNKIHNLSIITTPALHVHQYQLEVQPIPQGVWQFRIAWPRTNKSALTNPGISPHLQVQVYCQVYNMSEAQGVLTVNAYMITKVPHTSYSSRTPVISYTDLTEDNAILAVEVAQATDSSTASYAVLKAHVKATIEHGESDTSREFEMENGRDSVTHGNFCCCGLYTLPLKRVINANGLYTIRIQTDNRNLTAVVIRELNETSSIFCPDNQTYRFNRRFDLTADGKDFLVKNYIDDQAYRESYLARRKLIRGLLITATLVAVSFIVTSIAAALMKYRSRQNQAVIEVRRQQNFALKTSDSSDDEADRVTPRLRAGDIIPQDVVYFNPYILLDKMVCKTTGVTRDNSPPPSKPRLHAAPRFTRLKRPPRVNYTEEQIRDAKAARSNDAVTPDHGSRSGLETAPAIRPAKETYNTETPSVSAVNPATSNKPQSNPVYNFKRTGK